MFKFGFYILGLKGYRSLLEFINTFGAEKVGFVVSSKDLGVKNDFYEEIQMLCKENTIDFYERTKAKNFLCREVINAFAIGWRWIISDCQNLIVFHDSLLPKYRGFAPLVNALINGENRVGVTALRASENYDTGSIISQEYLEVVYPIKIGVIIDRITDLYVRLLLDICSKILNGNELALKEQDELCATYSPWRNALDYYIDWQQSSSSIARFVDALGDPYDGAKTIIDSQIIKINEVEVVDDVIVENRRSHIGKVLFMCNKYPIVICGSGLLKIIDFSDEKNNSLVGKMPFRTRFGV
jgi:methionyl-tRNA formyltransferase